MTTPFTDKVFEYHQPDYHYVEFTGGVVARFGKTPAPKDDPVFSPVGPEIVDLEISKDGCPNATRCAWCYKENSDGPPQNMTLETFKGILHKLRDCKVLRQIALGITGTQTNPDLIPIMEHCRSVGIAPNMTLTGKDLTPQLAKDIARLAGAVAISVYPDDKELGYKTIKQMSDLGIKQVNMHLLVSKITLDFCYEVLDDIKDNKVPGLRYVVMLSLKPKGRGQDLQVLTEEEHFALFNYARDNKIKFGMDSCAASRFERYMKQSNMTGADLVLSEMLAEPCESTLFSAYINVEGKFVPCSFCEGKVEPIDLTYVDNFLTEVWLSGKLDAFRGRLLTGTQVRACPVYPEIR